MIYEIIFHLIALVVIVRYSKFVPVQGDTLKLYLLASALFRFLVEFVRANPEQIGGLSGPQIVLLPLSALLVWHFARNWRRGLYRMPPAPAALHASPVARAAPPLRRQVGVRRYSADDA
jgi:prolipoprotein diacylglyceryltransferase